MHAPDPFDPTPEPSKAVLRHLTRWIGAVDYFAKKLLPYNPNETASPERRARPVIMIGLWLCFVLFGVIGTWAAFVPLSTGAVAPGKIMVDSNQREIQHLEGGIVKEILVRDGDQVAAGQVLIRLDPTNAKVRSDVAQWQLIAARASEQRLLAERDQRPAILFPNGWEEAEKTNPKLHDILESQRRIFASNRETLYGQINILQQKIEQSNEEIRGLRQQIAAANTQITLLNDEIKVVNNLLATGNALRPRLLALQRQQAELSGNRGQAEAMIARAKQTINEARISMLNQKTEAMDKTIRDLKDTQVQLASLEEQTRAASDIVRRIEITSPIHGTVTGLAVHTVGGVVQPGQTLLSLVPLNDKLIVEARVNPTDIDVVREGLKAQVRLTAFHLRYLRPIEGVVTTVSADRFEDKRTGEGYYTARIEIPQTELQTLGKLKLTPGMPAETLIVVGSRTMLSYIISPLRDSLGNALREE